MAEKRMFAKTIVDSDAFLDMPMSARLLYYDLGMRADDDGFINSPKKIMRCTGAMPDDLSILILRKFIIPFDNGVVVIKHWKIHNYIRKDTYNETPYIEQKEALIIDENKAYKLKNNEQLNEYQLPVDEQSTQSSLDKIRLEKYREEENFRVKKIDGDTSEKEQSSDNKKHVKHKYGQFNNVLLTDSELEKLNAIYDGVTSKIEDLSLYIESKNAKYKSHYATLISWLNKDGNKKKITLPEKTKVESNDRFINLTEAEKQDLVSRGIINIDEQSVDYGMIEESDAEVISRIKG